jgi:hypothetical protein
MYKNYINLENFNHNLVKIVLEDGKVESSMSVLFLGYEKMLADTCLHHGGSTFCDHMVSPKGLLEGSYAHHYTTNAACPRVLMDHKDRLHAICRLKRATCYRSKRHLPLRDKWDLKGFVIV